MQANRQAWLVHGSHALRRETIADRWLQNASRSAKLDYEYTRKRQISLRPRNEPTNNKRGPAAPSRELVIDAKAGQGRIIAGAMTYRKI